MEWFAGEHNEIVLRNEAGLLRAIAEAKRMQNSRLLSLLTTFKEKSDEFLRIMNNHNVLEKDIDKNVDNLISHLNEILNISGQKFITLIKISTKLVIQWQ